MRSYRPDIYIMCLQGPNLALQCHREPVMLRILTQDFHLPPPLQTLLLFYFFCENSLQIRIVGMILKFSLPLQILFFFIQDRQDLWKILPVRGLLTKQT